MPTSYDGYPAGMDIRHDPDSVDPSNQSGRPVMLTIVAIGLLVVLASLVGVYVLAH